MVIQNYLNFVQKNLGLSGVLLTPEILSNAQASLTNDQEINSAEMVPPEIGTNVVTESSVNPESGSSFKAENSYKKDQNYAAVFLRINDSRMSLAEDAEVEELFSKLRGALGFNAGTAPWLEVSLGEWQDALQNLKLQSSKVILMLDDLLEKGSHERAEWMIPDPAVLAQQISLKRPTWELLKEWRNSINIK